MLKPAVGAIFLLVQLSGVGGGLPQILQTDFKAVTPIKAGVRGEVAVIFTALPGYAVDRTLPFILNFTPVDGVKLAKTELKASPDDPKAKDQYYVDLPVIKVSVTAAKAGKYEIPGKLSYFFCSKKDGFCSTQKLDVKMPVLVQ
jgi:hypothetical protein